MPLRVEFKLYFRDVLLYSFMHQFLSLAMQSFFVLVACAMMSFAEEGDSGLTVAVGALVTYAAMWLTQCLFLVIYFLTLNTKTMLGSRVIEVRDDGLFEETRFNKSLYYWPGIVKLVRRPGFIAVYVSGLAAHVIPHRVFSDDIEREKFLTALQFKLASRQ